jgi:L-fuconolactonase
MVRIDAHAHLWDPRRGDYGWLIPSLQRLYRPFTAEQLQPLLRAAQVDGVVLVQAAPTAAETDYLLSIADRTPWVLGVVGWIDLDAAHVEQEIISRARQLVGVRPMLQDIDDTRWILHPQRAHAVRLVAENQLVFDALIRPAHLPVIAELADQYPGLQIVIDHGAKPAVDERVDAAWCAALQAVSQRTNVFCKLSGLLTELTASADATTAVSRHVSELLGIFGPGRLLWGSDWPVVTQVASYEEWSDLCGHCVADLDAHAREQLFGANAARIYGLDTNS